MSRGFAVSVRFACVAILALGLAACASVAGPPTGPGTEKGNPVDFAEATMDLAQASRDMSVSEDMAVHADMSKPHDLAQPADMTLTQACGSITVFGTCVGNNFVSCDPDTNTLDIESCSVCIVIEGIPTCF